MLYNLQCKIISAILSFQAKMTGKNEIQRNLKVLFICIGNSCRSPMAEAVLKHMISLHKDLCWEIDSAALRNWNVGYSPEERCIQVLAENGLMSNHIGRKIGLEDFDKYDYIFGMDYGNIEELTALAPPGSKAKVLLLGQYCGNPRDKIILDPYFENGIHGFRRAFEQIQKSCDNFIKEQIGDSLK